MGPKDLGTPAHFISSPRPMPRRKKCPRMNEGIQVVRIADLNHRKGRCHVAKGSPLEDPKGDFEPNGLAIGAWWKSNPWRSCHLRIKYPQLTP